MHEGIRRKPFVGLVEAEAVPNLRHVYSARSLIPAKFSGIKLTVLNAEKRVRFWRRGQSLVSRLSNGRSTARRRYKRREEGHWQADDEVARRHDEWTAKAGESFAVSLPKYHLDRRTRYWTDKFGGAPNWYWRTPTDSAGSSASSFSTLRLNR